VVRPWLFLVYGSGALLLLLSGYVSIQDNLDIINVSFSATIGLMLLAAYKLHRRLNHQQHKINALKNRTQKITYSANKFIVDRIVNLRRPLQGLIGIHDLYNAPGSSPEESQDYFEIADFCSRYLVRQLDKVQLFAEIGSGPYRFEVGQFSIRQCVGNAIIMASEQANMQAQAVVTEYDNALPEFAHGSEYALKKILVELLDNAIRYSGPGHAHLRIACNPNNKNELIFTVSDRGPGFSDKQMLALSSTLTSGKKTMPWLDAREGLGLIVVRRIINNLSGKLLVESKKGQGAKISFTLPERSLSVAHFDKAEVEVKNIRPKILLVEDDKITTKVISGFLDKFGIEHDVAENGREAIHKCQLKEFDVVLMDLHMPILNGFDASQAILHKLKIRKRPTIIAISSLCTQADRDRCNQIGILDFLAKPIRIEDLQLSLQSIGYLMKEALTSNNLLRPKFAIKQPEKNMPTTPLVPRHLIDFKRLYSSLDESIELCHDVLENVLVDLESGIEKMMSRAEANDRHNLQELLHKARGEMAMIMCDRGTDIINKLEHLTRKDDPAALSKALLELADVIELIGRELDSLVKNNSIAA